MRAGNKVSDGFNLEEISDGRNLKKKPATDLCVLPKKSQRQAHFGEN